jgi:hypothetical protein
MRDYFAGQALAAIPIRSWDSIVEAMGKPAYQLWAELAYKTADAMLAERAKST